MFLGSNQNIWVLDDDFSLQNSYQEYFSEPYKIKMIGSLQELKNLIDVNYGIKPSLLILNYFFHDQNVVEWLRQTGVSDSFDFPFIIVSNKDELNMFRSAFEQGALDYILKPVRKNELVARVERALTSAQNHAISAREVVLDGSKVSNLTSKQSQMLSLFMKSPTRSISREDILDKVWGSTTVHPKTVDVHLYNLRRKLNQHGFIIRSEGGGSWTLLSERINSH